ncbi:MAG TPA: ACT domain-containing protein, partial [Chloroflexota bacterium]
MTEFAALASARQRSDRMDALVVQFAARLPRSAAVVALGAFARQELTPRSELELLFLHRGELSAPDVTERVCYPLWSQEIHVEPLVCTVDECAAQARRSWAVATRLLDARPLAGDARLFEEFVSRMRPWRRDREHLRHRLRLDVQHRHASHASPTAAASPDIVAGRGGLQDLQALRWLECSASERTLRALDFLIATLSTVEEIAGHTAHRLSPHILERLASGVALVEQAYGHARWVAFSLDGALAPARDDRQLQSGFVLRDGQVSVDRRPPPIEHAASLGLRLANLVGLAPPSSDLLTWAGAPGAPIAWDTATLEQFWLMLRAADWRAFDFLDVTGLLTRYLPEMRDVWRKTGTTATGQIAVDSHSFLALRRLHEWSEGDDPLARRAWRSVRHRDWVYLAVLLHELDPEQAAAAGRRLGLPETACDTLRLLTATHQEVIDTATRRDLHDEDLILEFATRIQTRQRLGALFLVAVAHEMACGPTVWSAWKADLAQQLFGHLEIALGPSGELRRRRARSLEQHRERIRRQLERRNLNGLAALAARLPPRYVLTHTPAFVARHLALLGDEPLGEREVRMRADRRRQPGLWDVVIVARDRPGLLATVAGVLALRGASVLAADAATSADGLVLDAFTVSCAQPLQWTQVERDLRSALTGGIPLRDLLGSRPVPPEEAAAVHVTVDNAASQFFSVVEVGAPDQVGLLYRIASAL